MKNIIIYLKTTDPIPSYPVAENKKYKNYEDFKNFMNESKHEIPTLIYWLTKPIYHIQFTSFRLYDGFMKGTGFFKKPYKQLSKGSRFGASLLIVFLFLSFIIYSLIIRALNAVTLSINSFATLGFGQIPTTGLARYLVVFQGLIGWFLLSIFSVALINQVLS